AGSNMLPARVTGTYSYARFTGYIVAAITGMYTIGVNCQDGCNLFIGSTPLSLNVAGTDTAEVTLGYTQGGSIYLTAGVYYPITIEWAFGNSSGPELQLIWTLPQGQEGGGVTQLIPATALSDVQNSVSGRLDGSWWNGTPANYFPSGNNSIDFSNTQHPNKNLDNIPDGPTRSLLVPSGTGKVAASAASNLAAAPANDILMSDGAGNVQDSGVLVSSFLGVHGGNIAAGYAIEWNSDTGLSRASGGVLLVGDGTAGDESGTLVAALVYGGPIVGSCAVIGGASGHLGYISFQDPTGTQKSYIGYDTTPYTSLTVNMVGGGAFTIQGAIKITGSLLDSTGAAGSSGQVLQSTGSATLWAAGGGGTLASLTDVALSSPTNGQALLYNATSSKWQNTTLSGGGGGTLAALTDVALTSPIATDVLTYNGSLWVNAAPASGGGDVPANLTTWQNLNQSTGGLSGSGSATGLIDLSGTASADKVVAISGGGNTWSISFKLRILSNGWSSGDAGLILWDQVANKSFIFFVYFPDLNTYCQRYSAATFVSSVQNNLQGQGTAGQDKYFKAYADGTNIYLQISNDGTNWYTWYSEAIGTFLTPTHYGFLGTGTTVFKATVLNLIVTP